MRLCDSKSHLVIGITIFANFFTFMRYLITLFIVLASATFAHSQTYEVGGIIGGSNFIGDVGRTAFIYPNKLMFGGIAKWNRSQRHSFRLTVITSQLSGNDLDSPESRRQQRGYSFENRITEASLGIEFNFWEFNMYSGNRVSTPYLYTGLTYVWFDALRKVGDEISAYDGDNSLAIPMVIGFKTSVGTHNVLGFELGARYTFTDAIDGSFPEKGQPGDSPNLRFGDIENNDWYVFTGITFTFTFGRKPCYCNF